jgi:hypothetical protein
MNKMLVKRSHRRMVHGIVQLFGTAICILAYLVTLTVNSVTSVSNFGVHARTARVTAHVWVGYFTIGGLVVQVGQSCLSVFAASQYSR